LYFFFLDQDVKVHLSPPIIIIVVVVVVVVVVVIIIIIIIILLLLLLLLITRNILKLCSINGFLAALLGPTAL